MNLIRWNDDRLDGFAADYQVLDKKVDHLILANSKLEDKVSTISDNQTRTVNSRMQWWMIVATVMSNPLTAGVVYLITKGKSG